MLRPVREMMGIAGGVRNLQWLFTATFGASLLFQMLFGWIACRVPRRSILPWTYGFFILNLGVFAALMLACPDSAWTARAFYVWLSVFNLLPYPWHERAGGCDEGRPGKTPVRAGGQRQQPGSRAGACRDGNSGRSSGEHVAICRGGRSSGAGGSGGNVSAPLAGRESGQRRESRRAFSGGLPGASPWRQPVYPGLPPCSVPPF